jgi:hypothetical protein
MGKTNWLTERSPEFWYYLSLIVSIVLSTLGGFLVLPPLIGLLGVILVLFQGVWFLCKIALFGDILDRVQGTNLQEKERQEAKINRLDSQIPSRRDALLIILLIIVSMQMSFASIYRAFEASHFKETIDSFETAFYFSFGNIVSSTLTEVRPVTGIAKMAVGGQALLAMIVLIGMLALLISRLASFSSIVRYDASSKEFEGLVGDVNEIKDEVKGIAIEVSKIINRMEVNDNDIARMSKEKPSEND